MNRKRATKLTGQRSVAYYTDGFPPRSIDWVELIPLIGLASDALARYDALLTAIPNSDILLSPLTTQEAVLSSKIEGTYTTMGEVLEYEAGSEAISPERVDDIQEVINYRSAMRHAVDLMGELPLCGRLLRQCHEILLAGVRGENKARGEYRKIQNYIGVQGRPADEARFVPIAPERVASAMSAWEKYIHGDAADVLAQLAVAHAEFESIHPFLDGNGRLGRMIIPLFLFEKKRLQAPMFYLSEYLQEHDRAYKDRLLAVSRDDDWTGWCAFFLKAIFEQAQRNERRARRILELYEEKKKWILEATRSQHAITALDYLFRFPIFNSSTFIQSGEIPEATARRILGILADAGLLSVIRPGRGSRPKVFAFSELVRIAEGPSVS